jgi:uncharacterized protein
MTFHVVSGILLSFLSGMSLGLLGGGGSMLMVPILYYVMQISTSQATSISLLIVGATSLVGAIAALRKNEVAVRQALIFVVPSLLGIFLMRRFFLPAVPEQWGVHWGHTLTKSAFIMALFSAALFYVGFRMLKSPKDSTNDTIDTDSVSLTGNSSRFKTMISGFGVGSFTGIIGAGGGFLIVPALTLFLKLPFRIAIGTSLFIIAINSAVGVASDISHLDFANWNIIFFVLASSLVGMIAGMGLSKKIPTSKLNTIFAFLIIILGVTIFSKEFL